MRRLQGPARDHGPVLAIGGAGVELDDARKAGLGRELRSVGAKGGCDGAGHTRAEQVQSCLDGGDGGGLYVEAVAVAVGGISLKRRGGGVSLVYAVGASVFGDAAGVCEGLSDNPPKNV